MNSGKRLPRDVHDTFVIYAGLLYDVADTDCSSRMAALMGFVVVAAAAAAAAVINFKH